MSVNAKTALAVIRANEGNGCECKRQPYDAMFERTHRAADVWYIDRQPVCGGRDDKAAREEMTTTKVRWRLATMSVW